jgi:hypothetical protein
MLPRSEGIRFSLRQMRRIREFVPVSFPFLMPKSVNYLLFRRLSPTFRQKLDDIIAVHSSRHMTEHTKRVGGSPLFRLLINIDSDATIHFTSGLVRKDPVTSLHPLVRVHPITKQKCIFLNGEFITGFEGMKDPEFRMISDFLLEHLITGHDFQARVSWSPGSIVIFDNRSTIRMSKSFFYLHFLRRIESLSCHFAVFHPVDAAKFVADSNLLCIM